jgi:hypothetical protein
VTSCSRWSACKDRHPELLLETKVIAVIPDLHGPPALEAKDIDAGERHQAAGRFHRTPWAGVRSSSRSAGCDVVAFGDDDLNLEPQVQERGSESKRYPLLPLRTWRRVSPEGHARRSPVRKEPAVISAAMFVFGVTVGLVPVRRCSGSPLRRSRQR